MSVEIRCGKCGEKIATMKMLKPIREALSQYDGKCPACGQKLSASDYSLDVEES